MLSTEGWIEKYGHRAISSQLLLKCPHCGSLVILEHEDLPDSPTWPSGIDLTVSCPCCTIDIELAIYWGISKIEVVK